MWSLFLMGSLFCRCPECSFMIFSLDFGWRTLCGAGRLDIDVSTGGESSLFLSAGLLGMWADSGLGTALTSLLLEFNWAPLMRRIWRCHLQTSPKSFCCLAGLLIKYLQYFDSISSNKLIDQDSGALTFHGLYLWHAQAKTSHLAYRAFAQSTGPFLGCAALI